MVLSHCASLLTSPKSPSTNSLSQSCSTAYKSSDALDKTFISGFTKYLIMWILSMIATTPNKYSGSLLKIFQEQVDAFGGSNIANVLLHENICHTQVPVDDFLTICTPEQKNYQGGGGLCNLVASPRLSSTRFCMHIMMNSGGCCFDVNQFDKQLDHNNQWRCNTHVIYRILSCQRK